METERLEELNNSLLAPPLSIHDETWRMLTTVVNFRCENQGKEMWSHDLERIKNAAHEKPVVVVSLVAFPLESENH